MKTAIIDQIGHKFHLNKTPERIVSLVPSQTELLFDLGLESKIVGITKFCIHPKVKCKKIPKIGGTKKFNFDLIKKLEPDLIIANKEENYKEGIEILQKKYPVWTSDIILLSQALDMIDSIGKITNSSERATTLINRIQNNFKKFNHNNYLKKKVLYLIWENPYMAVGKGTFIDEMLQICGFENIIYDTRYPIITKEEILNLKPDIILLSSEPYPFKEKHIEELNKICKNTKTILVDGEMFSWYGSRLQYASDYFTKILDELYN